MRKGFLISYPLLLQLTVFLFPSVEQFEEKLCSAVNEDRLAKASDVIHSRPNLSQSNSPCERSCCQGYYYALFSSSYVLAHVMATKWWLCFSHLLVLEKATAFSHIFFTDMMDKMTISVPLLGLLAEFGWFPVCFVYTPLVKIYENEHISNRLYSK